MGCANDASLAWVSMYPKGNPSIRKENLMLQLRCTYCQTMFAISRDETLAALERLDEENLKFYDAHCPKCRRANRVERFKLEVSFPGWKNEIKQMEKAAAVNPAPLTAPAPSELAVEVEEAGRKRHTRKQAGAKTASAEKTTLAVKSPARKPAEKKPAPKPAAKKPAVKPAAKPAAKKTAAKPAAKPVVKPAVKKTIGSAKKK